MNEEEKNSADDDIELGEWDPKKSQVTWDPKKSKTIQVPVIDDHQMLLYAMSQAVRWSYGVMAMEVWVMNDHGRLSCPMGGNCIDPVYLNSHDDTIEQALLGVQAEHYNYSHSKNTLAVTEGIPGYLWTKSSNTGSTPNRRLNSSMVRSSMKRGGSKKLRQSALRQSAMMVPEGEKISENIVLWSDVGPIVNDPDQPYSRYAKSMYDAGFGVCGGMPFHMRNCEGIVVFFARGTVDKTRLTNVLNEEYLLSAANEIGSILNIRSTREISRIHRKREKHMAIGRAKSILGSLYQNRIKKTGIEKAHDAVSDIFSKAHAKNENHSIWLEIDENHKNKKDPYGHKTFADYMDMRKTNASCCDVGLVMANGSYIWGYWWRKMHGGGVEIKGPKPPSFAAYTFVAVFVTYMILSYINDALKDAVGNNDDVFQMGVLGSLMTVVYGLMEAPASQPRNIILGQGGCMFIAILCSLIPGDGRLLNFRSSLAISLGAAFMASTGLLHPPGTSVAYIFSKFFDKGNKLSWQSVGFLFLANAILSVLASAFNNLAVKRHYPQYWGYLPDYLSTQFRKRFGKTEGKTL